MKKFIAWLRAPEWSPYVGGALLGLLSIATLLITTQVAKRIADANIFLFGASGAFENIGGAIMQLISPALANNMYWNFVMPAGLSIGVMMLIGIFIGALFSALASGTFKWRIVSDDQWIKMFGSGVWKRWLVLFFGAILLEYGAGIAGGCTSGLAISGGVQLAPAAFLFMAGMFASGILTAMIMYRKRF